MKKSNITKYLSIILLIIWLSVIFFFSSNNLNKSNNTSYKITDVVIKVIDKENNNTDLRNNVNYIIRKGAHFTEYAILGILVLNVLRYYPIETRKKVIISIIFCVLYACTDEIHQMSSIGRSPMFKDVLIDSSGSILAILLFKGVFNKKHVKL